MTMAIRSRIEMVYELRTAGDPLAYVNSVREIVRQADSRCAGLRCENPGRRTSTRPSTRKSCSPSCARGFAILALVIACVGLYGTVSYNVARRTGEIGIRMALGAQRGAVVRMVLRQVLVLAAVGLAIGLPAALSDVQIGRIVSVRDEAQRSPGAHAAVTILLSAATLAGYVPARKASRIDPMTALRHE